MKFNKTMEQKKGNLFIKINPSESIVGVLSGEPFEFEQHFGQPATVCQGKGCQLCANGAKPSFRFRINFIINENGAFTPKILEMGWTVYKSLKALNEDYDLAKHFIKIRREGQKKETIYSIIVPPKAELSLDQLNSISAIRLLELEHKNKKQEQESDNSLPDFDVSEANGPATENDDNLSF